MTSMGIIKRQTIQGSVISYAGVAIGFVTASILQPFLLTTAQIGLLRVLNSYSNILAQIFSLGFNQVAVRLFPDFRSAENKHNGFLFLGILTLILGFGLSVLFYIFAYDWMISSGEDDSPLFAKYVYLILPLVFFNLLFRIFDAYIRMLYNAVIGTFFKEFLQRLFILVTLILVGVQWVDFDQFMFYYTAAICLPGLLIACYPLFNKTMYLQPKLSFIDRSIRKKIYALSAYGILSGAGAILILEVDSLMVFHLVGESATGVYATMFYFGVLVSIASRALKRIATPVLSDAWKNSDLNGIRKVYQESSIYQFIIGGWLFLGLWINANYILEILPASFKVGKYVILYIGLGQLFDMLTGVNAEIIATSEKFKMNTYFTLVLLGLMIPLNYIFIINLDLGLTGAAVASCISMFLVNFARLIYLRRRYSLQPFSMKTLKFLLVFGLSWLVASQIPRISNPYLGILLCGSIVTFLVIGGSSIFRLLPSIKGIFNSRKN